MLSSLQFLKDAESESVTENQSNYDSDESSVNKIELFQTLKFSDEILEEMNSKRKAIVSGHKEGKPEEVRANVKKGIGNIGGTLLPSNSVARGEVLNDLTVSKSSAKDDLKQKAEEDFKIFKSQLEMEYQEKRSQLERDLESELQTFKAKLALERSEKEAGFRQEMEQNFAEFKRKLENEFGERKADLSKATLKTNAKSVATMTATLPTTSKAPDPTFSKQLEELESDIKKLRSHLGSTRANNGSSCSDYSSVTDDSISEDFAGFPVPQFQRSSKKLDHHHVVPDNCTVANGNRLFNCFCVMSLNLLLSRFESNDANFIGTSGNVREKLDPSSTANASVSANNHVHCLSVGHR